MKIPKFSLKELMTSPYFMAAMLTVSFRFQGMPWSDVAWFIFLFGGGHFAVWLIVTCASTQYQLRRGVAQADLIYGKMHLKVGPVIMAWEGQPCSLNLFFEKIWTRDNLKRAADEINLHVRKGRRPAFTLSEMLKEPTIHICFVENVPHVRVVNRGAPETYVAVWLIIVSLRNKQMPMAIQSLEDWHIEAARQYYDDHRSEIDEAVREVEEE